MPMVMNQPKRKNPRGIIDPDVARDQLRRGLTNQEIADSHGITQSAVWRFLNRSKLEQQAVESFKANRADIYTSFQAKCLDLQTKIIESFGKDGVVEALKTQEKASMLFALNASHGTSYDKERLERGLSTENHSIVSKLLDARVQARYKPAKDKQPSKQTAQAETEIKEIISVSECKQEITSTSA